MMKIKIKYKTGLEETITGIVKFEIDGDGYIYLFDCNDVMYGLTLKEVESIGNLDEPLRRLEVWG